jgi:hypothetical protein
VVYFFLKEHPSAISSTEKIESKKCFRKVIHIFKPVEITIAQGSKVERRKIEGINQFGL